jgi:dihydrofolate reductase
MAKLRVHSLAMSLDGFVAGPDQDLDNPLGVGGERLHEWVFASRFGREMIGQDPGPESPDDPFLRQGEAGVGATVMGRNMFGPVRGPWTGESGESGESADWTGWWGPNPPYHHDVFVLTHHPRQSFAMEGGTTFHFVTEGIEAALDRAFAAAGGQDVRLGGGAATVRAYLGAGLVDELNLAVVPVLLGRGERLFDGPVDYAVAETVSTPAVTHVRLVRTGAR